MSDKAKKGLKLAGYAAVILLTAFILYHLFKDSYKEIAAQLNKTNIWMLLLMILLGNMYYIIDAIMYSYLLKKDGTPVNMLRCIAVSYMGIFFNVTTFGAGIKPGQVVYLHNKGINVGRACAITTMPYVFHKTVIVGYAVIMLLFNNAFVMRNFSSTFGYIYIGAAINIVIITGIILICAAEWFHKLAMKLLDKILKKEKFTPFKNKIKNQVEALREGTKNIIKSPAAWISFTVINMIKMSCWYVIPIIAIYAAGGSLGGVTVAQAITVTALMQLIMGVIPTSGGVGSLEVVFSLLFAAVFGKVMAGSSMVLYRISTYYIPFLISVIIMLAVGKDMKSKKKAGGSE